jgi:hypothetical protein
VGRKGENAGGLTVIADERTREKGTSEQFTRRGHLIKAKLMFFYQVGVPAFGQFAAWCPTGVFDMNTTDHDAHNMDFR